MPPATAFTGTGKANFSLSEGEKIGLLCSSSGGLIKSLSHEAKEPPPLPSDSGKAQKPPSGGQPHPLPPDEPGWGYWVQATATGTWTMIRMHSLVWRSSLT